METKASLMGVHDWSMGFSFGELRTEYRWQEQSFDGVSLGYYGGFWDLDTGEFLGDGSLSDWGSMAGVFLDTVREVRHREIRLERTDRSAQSVLDLTLDLLQRNSRGEYLGQEKGRQHFLLWTLSKITGWSLHRLTELYDRAAEDGLIAMNGTRLWAVDEPAILHGQPQALGRHGRLQLEDWGRWMCLDCRGSGGPSIIPSSRSATGTARLEGWLSRCSEPSAIAERQIAI